MTHILILFEKKKTNNKKQNKTKKYNNEKQNCKQGIYYLQGDTPNFRANINSHLWLDFLSGSSSFFFFFFSSCTLFLRLKL